MIIRKVAGGFHGNLGFTLIREMLSENSYHPVLLNGIEIFSLSPFSGKTSYPLH
jgi:hypothetical protein